MNKNRTLCCTVPIAIVVTIVIMHGPNTVFESTLKSAVEPIQNQIKKHLVEPIGQDTTYVPGASTEHKPDCLSSYPDFCIPPSTPDLDCPDMRYSNFTVRGSDPHRFDRDNDGIGCESSQSGYWYVEPDTSKPDAPVRQKHLKQDCLTSYPDFCIPPGPPDLNCSDVRYSDFTVRGSDPHGFDRDNDGVGCESR